MTEFGKIRSWTQADNILTVEFEKQKKQGNTNRNFVQLPSKGIPDNPTNQNIGAMTQEEQINFGKEINSANTNLKESDYVFSGGIFDAQ